MINQRPHHRLILSVAIQRVRLRLSRLGEASAYSHIQQIEVIRKSLEKSGWPVSMTQGKKPKMKISFGPAISVGYESLSEYCDVEFHSRMDLQKAKTDLEPHLPTGFSVLGINPINRFLPSLEESTNLAVYEVKSELLKNTDSKWQEFWAKEQFLVVKKKLEKDVVIDARPCVRQWELGVEGQLMLQVRFGPGRTLKPERIIQAVCALTDEQVAMGTPTCQLQVKRAELFFEKPNGELMTP